MTSIRQQVIELEEKAHQKGLTMQAACALAGIQQATFSRWKYGKCSPMMGKFQRLAEVIEQYRGKHDGRNQR